MKPPIRPENAFIDSPFMEKKGSLKYRIGKSDIFIMYGSRTYYYDIVRRDQKLMEQFEYVRRYKVPSVLLIDKKMNVSEKINLKNAIGAFGINVIREIEYDFKNEVERKRIEKKLGEIASELVSVSSHVFRWQ